MPTEPCAHFPQVPPEARLELFRLVLLQRLFEERALTLYRQGRIAGSFYDGRGQEAVAAAAGLALQDGDVVCPLNRELACHFARNTHRRPVQFLQSIFQSDRRQLVTTCIKGERLQNLRPCFSKFDVQFA